MSSWNIPNSGVLLEQKKSEFEHKDEIIEGGTGQSVMSISPLWKFVNIVLKSAYDVISMVLRRGPKGDQVVAPVWFTAWTLGPRFDVEKRPITMRSMQKRAALNRLKTILIPDEEALVTHLGLLETLATGSSGRHPTVARAVQSSSG